MIPGQGDAEFAPCLDARVRDAVLLRPEWPAPAAVRAAVTLRHALGVGRSLPPFDDFNLGDRCGDEATAVAHNRAALRHLLGIDVEPRWLQQVHGSDVLRFGPTADAPPGGSPARGDAAVTDVPGTVLAILSADCLPVLFCARDGSEVAAAHAGWRGLAAGVLERSVAAMRTPPAQLLAWLGPAAGPSAYEVGVEVRAAFVTPDPGAAAAFAATRPGHWRADLFALARRRLAAAGVGQIWGGRWCTISDAQRFYSHRRDGVSGRMASLIWIESDPATQ